jgi:undecaprenol kinase/diacylglycerol kinase (ATP)
MKTQRLVKSFRHAFDGIFHFLGQDRNGRIHAGAAVLVFFAGIFFHVNTAEWISLLICFALVIGFEMCNHALENLCDLVHADHHPTIKTVKDVAAAAVLWSAIISVIIGLLIFIPKIIAIL